MTRDIPVSDSTPIPLNYEVLPPTRVVRPSALVGIAAGTVLAGMLVGASANVINGAVSPAYFVSVMGWAGNVWSMSIVQGVLEGFVAGLVLSVVFTTTVGLITRATCEFGTALRWLARIVLAVYVMWVIGGVLGIGLAACAPQFFRDSFIEVPADRIQMLRYAWVGGSIWGAYAGGPIAVIGGLIVFQRSWRKMLKRDAELDSLPPRLS
jgi:hypothetical protein